MVQDQSRRNFLRSASLAAGALGLAGADAPLLAQAQAGPSTPVFFPADKLADAMKTLQGKPGNDNLFESTASPLTVVMTTEEKKAAKEFEWHEGRDHIVQIVDGATLYEVGGAPQNGRNTKPGEWLAPVSQGALEVTMRKGDMLVIPRGTPHKRSTETSVTFVLISTAGRM